MVHWSTVAGVLSPSKCSILLLLPCRHISASSDKTDGGYNNWKAALEQGKGFNRHAWSASHIQAMSIWTDRKMRSESGSKVSSMVNEQQVQKKTDIM